ncbi:3-dehydroquinate synthase [Bacteroidia bacterium]|nr:3-dehydroquinate synthase [Bacteroidia bacterium]
MIETILVKRPQGEPSKVVIGDALSRLEELLPGGRRVIVITDRNLLRHWPELCQRYEHICIGLGERNKTLATVESIYRRLLEMNVDRECFVLGIGGGIVTDIAGFVASTYMRGVRFGFVASSLLAQVDASVGGKNGVNLARYKNIVGTFNQPDFVLCDTGMLGTLPDREFRAGMAEIVKAGIIADPRLFALLESHGEEEFRRDESLMRQAITAAVRVKAAIVEADEREAGERRLLNLGHTFAHAIEKLSHRYVHGEAVAVGTVVIADLSARLGVCDAQTARRIRQAISHMGLPTESGIPTAKLLKAIRLDKKRESDRINLVLVGDIGRCEVRKMSFSELERLFEE